jgi:hypothetical protein
MNKIITLMDPFGHQHEIKINKTKDKTLVVKSLLLYVHLSLLCKVMRTKAYLPL